MKTKVFFWDAESNNFEVTIKQTLIICILNKAKAEILVHEK